MKREKKLILLSGILIICVAGAVVISRTDFEEKMTGTETIIIGVDSEDITYLAWNYEDEEMEFICEDGKWSYKADEKMDVDQDLLNEIAENLSDITSDKKVEEVQSLGVYGLSDPAYHITVKTEEETYEISVGDETFSDGEVYISNGDDYVYLTDAGLIDEISYSLLDCVQKEEIPEMEQVCELVVENQGSVDVIYKENSGYCYSDAYVYFLKDGDNWKNLDNEKTQEMASTLSEFTWEECADYYAEDSELALYGLDDPDAVVDVTYEPKAESEEDGVDNEDEKDKETDMQEVFSYEVGTANETYYAKLKDSNIIYKISEDVYLAATETSYDELKPDEVILLNWDTVESIEIEMDGKVYRIELESDGEDSYSYKFRDLEIDFSDILDQLSQIAIADQSEEEENEDGSPQGEPDLSDNKVELAFTFQRNTEEYDTVELDFYQYDGSYCIVSLNGDELNYTSRSPVADLKEAVNSVILDSLSEE